MWQKVGSSRRALLSVSDKKGIAALARALHEAGAEIVSTGGTAAHLRESGLPVRPLEQVTGVPELLGGRVKTLHPAVAAGLLARGTPDDLDEIARHSIEPIDLVAVTLYPFEQAEARGAAMAEMVEEIDIGGVTLLRAAAKNWARVTVLCDPGQYQEVIAAVGSGRDIPDELRLRLAAEAFARVAAYDAAIASYFQRAAGQAPFPERLTLTFNRRAVLRYGENPHQQAALYEGGSPAQAQVIGARLLAGPALSYNNIADLEAAWAIVSDLPRPAAAVVKHMNPCGAAVGTATREALERALGGDPVSAFGGIVAANAGIDLTAAEAIAGLYADAVIAPSVDSDALALLASKRGLKVLAAGDPREDEGARRRPDLEFRSVAGGLLVQEPDAIGGDESGWQVATGRAPTEAEWEDLRLAWAVCAHVKSNAIVLSRDRQVVGVGAGQMSRVDSVRLAAHKAQERAQGASAASDGFFPFADGIEAAAAAGVTAVIQPGGSIRDAEVVRAAERLGIAMVITGRRHFRH